MYVCVSLHAVSTTSLPPPGQCVKSVYTFNAVAALCFLPEGDGYIITGSGVSLQ